MLGLDLEGHMMNTESYSVMYLHQETLKLCVMKEVSEVKILILMVRLGQYNHMKQQTHCLANSGRNVCLLLGFL